MADVNPGIFKAYDIRGIYPTDLNEEIAYKVGLAYTEIVKPETVIVGRDARVSGPALHKQILKALTEMGVNVIDVGQVSSDMYYYACATRDLPGIMITASHNPKEYNGFKMVRRIPYFLTGDDEIKQIKEMIINDNLPQPSNVKGTVTEINIMDEFVNHILSFIDPSKLKNMHIVADTANGMVGPIIDQLEQKLSTIKFTKMYFEPDGNFPNHGGDPLDPENRKDIEKKISELKPDFGIMADPDGDRFFVVDQKGRFIPGDFMTAILSEHFLKRRPGTAIVYDIRASKVVPETITRLGGKPLYNRVGHSYIKKRMAENEAVFGGEVSGHYYFADFYYCDSAVVTMLFLIEYLSQTNRKLHEIIDEMESKYFISNEINSTVEDNNVIFKRIEDHYGKHANEVLHVDGVSMEFDDWRFNVRGSNTEPLIRLNLEANSKELMEKKRDEVLSVIRA